MVELRDSLLDTDVCTRLTFYAVTDAICSTYIRANDAINRTGDETAVLGIIVGDGLQK